MRRVLLLITDLDIGGTPTVVRELAMRLREPGQVHVEVACLARRGPVATQLDDAGVPVIALGATRPTQLPRVVRQVRRLVCDGQVDTVISFLVHANTVAALASRACPSVRFIQSIQTTQPTPRWQWWAQQFAQRAADTMLVPSTAVAHAAEERCGVEAGRIAIIPNAVDPSDFQPVNVFASPVDSIGFLGRLDPVKNITALLGAMRWLRSEPVETHIFGDGPQHLQLETFAKSAGVADRVFFHGAVASPQDALEQIDLLVLPSKHEGFGLVLIEAMAAGVPVIAGDGGGALDVVQHEINGLVCRFEDDGRQLVNLISRLRDDARLRRGLIERGLRTVRERFSWNVVMPQYHRLLDLT